MNKTIIKHNNFIECFFFKKIKLGSNTKVHGLISKNVESARTNDIFKLKNNE